MSLEDVELHLVDSVDEAAAMLRWLSTRHGSFVSLDLESTGLNVFTDKIRLAQLGDERYGWAMDWERWRGAFEDAVNRYEGKFSTYNGPMFDCQLLEREGVRIPHSRIDDTRLMGHVLDPRASSALKSQASTHVDPRAANLQRALDDMLSKAHPSGWSWATVPIVSEGPMAVYWQYAALDTVLDAQLRNVHLPRVQAEAPMAYDLELAFAWVAAKMRANGVAIDRDFTARKSTEFLAYVESVDRWCVDNFGVKPGSNDAIIELYERGGYQFTKLTGSGTKFSLDKEVLQELAVAFPDHPLASAILQRRRVQKLQSTYLRAFLAFSERDGFLHPNINTIGGVDKTVTESGGGRPVATGRTSMDSPNMQNLPRKNNSNPAADVVRDCVVTRYGLHPSLTGREAETDGVLLMCDFDQIEMRMMAHLSNDPGLRAAFIDAERVGTDFFTVLTRQIFSDDAIVKSDPRRQTTKNAGYAKSYGAGVEQFSRTAGVSEEIGAAFLARFDQLYPGVRRFQNDVIGTARERFATEGSAYVRSPITNRRYVALDPDKAYVLVNYLIQGPAAEVLKLKGLELDAAGLGDYMTLPVHDEYVLDVPRSVEADAITALRDVMNDNELFSVPLTASVSRGRTWGGKEEVKL